MCARRRFKALGRPFTPVPLSPSAPKGATCISLGREPEDVMSASRHGALKGRHETVHWYQVSSLWDSWCVLNSFSTG